eukprot:UN03731
MVIRLPIDALAHYTISPDWIHYQHCLYNPIFAEQINQPLQCGGSCDLTCPERFMCTKNTDCFHQMCNEKGYCGELKQIKYNFSSNANNLTIYVTYIIATLSIFVTLFLF